MTDPRAALPLVLVVGGGGREHALGWVLARSPRRPRLLFAPGNPGTAALGENVPVAADDLDGLVRLADERAVDLVVVGPEAPLVAGLADRLAAAGVATFGPGAAAARLEGSKAFAKAFMARWGVPTAAHRTFTPSMRPAAEAYATARFAAGVPVVVKASGLAAGKGVVVCDTAEEAHAALADAFGGAFGAAGAEVVLEDRMVGEEASLFVVTDGERYAVLPPAQDHKRIGEGDTGPNTGGMGAYAPAPVVTGRVLTEVCRTIVEPTLGGLRAERMPYRGVLFVGLMLTADGPRVIEYNVRFGDPETQAVLPLLTSDVFALLDGAARGDLGAVRVEAHAGSAACVVLASGGYPGAFAKGKPIRGIAEAEAAPDALVFHAGTAAGPNSALVTSGGRVLGVTGLGPTLPDALARAYAAADRIAFEGRTVRHDIGHRALRPPVASW